MHFYQFTVNSPTNINLEKLNKEISSQISGLTSLTLLENQLTAYFVRELTDNEITLIRNLIDTHNPFDAEETIKNLINKAMDFGKQLIIEFGTENVLMGLNSSQIKTLLAKLSNIQALLLGGALRTALQELEQLQPDELLPQSRIKKYANKIRVYLGLPEQP